MEHRELKGEFNIGAVGKLELREPKIISFSDLPRKKQESLVGYGEEWLAEDIRLIQFGKVLGKADPLQNNPDLWMEFAGADFSKDKNLIAFHEKYGPWRLWGTPGYERGYAFEFVGQLLEDQAHFARLVELAEAIKTPLRLRKFYGTQINTAEMIKRAGEEVCRAVFEKTKGVQSFIFPVDKEFFNAYHYQRLDQAIYWQFKDVLASKKELKICDNPDCRRVFVPNDKRQIFHDDQCRDRYHHKQRYVPKPRKKKGKGKGNGIGKHQEK